ncbi:divisome protein SepX/GlpR [Microlunatus ginsengisoli]|uniref:Uncharacterized protein n=1 Tax=Microlunatus ginsengisoli TaxID=363863 RepID=A0ABP7AUV0_9ACTN
MGTTGVIFAAIAIAWLAYLVPHFVRRRGDEPETEEADPADRFSANVHIVRHGTAPLLDQDLEPIAEYEVSTPLTRRAAIADLRRLDRLAANRRRRVLLGLLAVISLVIGLCAVGWLPWWSAAIPGGLLVAFFAVSRVSVHLMRKRLDQRYRSIVGGGHEKTVFLGRKKVESDDRIASAEPAEAASEPKPHAVALWDPVPITMPTYVSKPLAPRTVRTIDLSGPQVAHAPAHPVTADAPETAETPAAQAERGDEGGSRDIASA